MKLVYFILFTIISYGVLLQIMRFTTYHRYFLKAAPILIGYAVLVGYLMFRFNLSDYFLYYLMILIVLFIMKFRSERKLLTAMSSLQDNTEESEKIMLDTSFKNTFKYLKISVITFLLVYIVAFLYFYN